MTRCPCCDSDEVELLGKAEADDAVIGEDEYVEHCLACHAEWVRAVQGGRTEVLS